MKMGLRLLIADDNAEVRGLIKRALARLGAEFVECADGSEAVDSYAAQRPDLVLMDVEMPVLDGITATQQIITADPSARVIILTNHDQPSLREAARAAGAWSYVLKENLLAVRTLVSELTSESSI